MLADAGIPSLLFGAAEAGAHAAVEWTTIDSLHPTTAFLTNTIREFIA